MSSGEGPPALATGAEEAPFEVKAYGPDPARFRIGLSPIPHARWFEGGAGDPRPRKAALLQSSPQSVWGEAAGSRPAQIEALELVVRWRGLTAYPTDREGPLLTAAFLVQDDLCLMERRAKGWTLTAASLSSGSFFTPKETVGLALEDLHAPVPGFGDRLFRRVERIFDNLPPDEILERRNWSIVNSAELSLPDASSVRARIADIPPEEALEALFVRSERQTVRRLPRTGAILFSIRIWRENLKAVLGEPSRADAFRRAWTLVMGDADPSVRTYKAFALYEPLVRPLLQPRPPSTAS